MTGSGPAIIGQRPIADQPESEVIESRFGRVTIYPRQPVIFPNGILGMPGKMQFSLTHFPSEKMARFKLLQSLEDQRLSFITLPLAVDNPIIERTDIEQAARDLGFPMEEVATLLIVSVHRESGNTKLSVNARAPLLMHVNRRLAAQYVFAHSKYDIRHMITL